MFLSVACSLWSVIFFSGCSPVKKIQHLSQLLMLKNYVESQGEIGKAVKQQDALFDEMRSEIEEGSFRYLDQRQILQRFGDPVFKRATEYQGKSAMQWLYRYAKDFDGDKVYLYFDDGGKMIDFEYIEKIVKK